MTILAIFSARFTITMLVNLYKLKALFGNPKLYFVTNMNFYYP